MEVDWVQGLELGLELGVWTMWAQPGRKPSTTIFLVRECFAIRGDVPVMEAPPVNSKLLHELELRYHRNRNRSIIKLLIPAMDLRHKIR